MVMAQQRKERRRVIILSLRNKEVLILHAFRVGCRIFSTNALCFLGWLVVMRIRKARAMGWWKSS